MGLFLNFERPVYGSCKKAMAGHWVLAALSGGLLLAAAAMSPDVFWQCPFLRLTGYPCPSCGMTRGFIAMAHGRWRDVFSDCPLAALLYAATALIFAVNSAALLFGVRLSPAFRPKGGARGPLFAAAFFLAFFLNWIYRLAFGIK